MSVVPDSNEPNPERGETAPIAVPGPAPAPIQRPIAVPSSPGIKESAAVLGVALMAGLLAWGIGEKTHDHYGLSAEAEAAQNARNFALLNREKRIIDQKNAAITFGAFGAVLGLLAGAAGGGLRRSIPGGASAAVAGLLLGGIGAGLAAYALTPLFGRFYSDDSPSLVLSFLVRGGIWAAIGMTASLALGAGWQGPLGIPRALIGGLAGSVCGTIAFEVVNAVLFPGDRNDAVIPSSTEARLLASLLVSVGVVFGALLLGSPPSKSAGRSTQADS
jgi:hypothetical protein